MAKPIFIIKSPLHLSISEATETIEKIYTKIGTEYHVIHVRDMGKTWDFKLLPEATEQERETINKLERKNKLEFHQ